MCRQGPARALGALDACRQGGSRRPGDRERENDQSRPEREAPSLGLRERRAGMVDQVADRCADVDEVLLGNRARELCQRQLLGGILPGDGGADRRDQVGDDALEQRVEARRLGAGSRRRSGS